MVHVTMPLRLIRGVLAGAALPALLAGSLAAQEPRTGDALWFGLGLGPGVARVQCDICRADRGTAVTGEVRLGGRLSRKVLIGADVILWAGGSQSGVRESMWGLGAVGYFFPRPGGSWYWKTGFGLLSWHSVDGHDELSAGAPGLVLGTGWEFRVARRYTLAPYATLFIAPVGGDIKFNGSTIQKNAGLLLGHFGVSFTRH